MRKKTNGQHAPHFRYSNDCMIKKDNKMW